MKSVHELTDNLIKQMPYTTSLERTKLLVEIDKIIDKPYRDYRIELNEYSVRYKATHESIYIYSKRVIDHDNLIEYINDVDIPEGYKIKVCLFKNNIGVGDYYDITRYVNEIKNKFFNRLFGR